MPVALRIPAVFASLLVLGACAHAPRKTPPVPADASRPALAPPAAVSPRSASQVIHAVYGARALTLRTAIQVDSAVLKVVGVNATGQRLFTVSYDGNTISADQSPFVPDNLDPARVLADMQLALWPLATVQPAFAEQGLSVTEPFAGVRRLARGDTLVAEVHYAAPDPWNGRLWFVNFEFDYSLTIDTSTAATN